MAQLAWSRPVLLPTAQTARAATGGLYKVTIRVKTLTAPFTSRTQPGLRLRQTPARTGCLRVRGKSRPPQATSDARRLPRRVQATASAGSPARARRWSAIAARKPSRPPVQHWIREPDAPTCCTRPTSRTRTAIRHLSPSLRRRRCPQHGSRKEAALVRRDVDTPLDPPRSRRPSATGGQARRRSGKEPPPGPMVRSQSTSPGRRLPLPLRSPLKQEEGHAFPGKEKHHRCRSCSGCRGRFPADARWFANARGDGGWRRWSPQ
jgi:hypothetical protein